MILNSKDDITPGMAGVANSGMDICGIQNKRLYHGHKFKNKIKTGDKIIYLWNKKNTMKQPSLLVETNT